LGLGIGSGSPSRSLDGKSQVLLRLNKLLALAGVASRRGSDELIASGKVTVDGKKAALGLMVSGEEEVFVDGKRIETGSGRMVYLVMNKPKGALTTSEDTHGRRTVIELLPPTKERLFPVGRLDQETTGLLILTNDGELAYRLTHPKFGVDKKYQLLVAGRVKKDELERMRNGIRLEEGMTGKAKVRVIEENDEVSLIEMIIHEGKKRQIRRMSEVVGWNLIELRRVAVGGVELGKLKEGENRSLTEDEVSRLKKGVGLG